MVTLCLRSHRRCVSRCIARFGVVMMACLGAGASSADSRLIDQIHTIRIPGFVSFVAAEHFAVGSIIGGRRLGSVGFNFKQHFLEAVETGVPTASVAVWNLRYAMGDASLVKMRVVRLAHVYAIMEMGSASAGHTDWRSNFAYVRSPLDHRPWAVHWSANHYGEWTIGAVRVPHADLDWPAGSRWFGADVNEQTAESNLVRRMK